MDTTISATIVVIAALSTGIVSTIGFSTSVHAQATHLQGPTCTGPDKVCGRTVTTPSGNTNVQFHAPGSTQTGGATVSPNTCIVLPTPTCNNSVNTPSGNIEQHQHNTTTTPGTK